MPQHFNFSKTTMPKTRKADYYLGCLGSSVFIDFNRTQDNQIYLVRISFDGYGCCNLPEPANCLNEKDSQIFIAVMEKNTLNQETMARLVKEAIKINKEHIWTDALEQYRLI